MADKRIPWHAHEFTPEIMAGLIPDGMNEYLHPNYPDLPYPDAIENVTWYRDPLVYNDEPAPWPEPSWAPDNPENPWLYDYGPYYDPHHPPFD